MRTPAAWLRVCLEGNRLAHVDRGAKQCTMQDMKEVTHFSTIRYSGQHVHSHLID